MTTCLFSTGCASTVASRAVQRAVAAFVIMVMLLVSQSAVACMAPSMYFESGSAEGGNRIVELLLKSGLKGSSANCRYRIVGRIDANEAMQGRNDLALQRANAVVSVFVAHGFSKDQFVVEAEFIKTYAPWRYSPDNSPADRKASIHSVVQPGQVTCLQPMTTCPICTRKLPDGGECWIIPGSGALN
ncbi:MAG TPA: hypothetical protein VJ890_04335 [Vineibacter sp.]|nr:hypothetical protein [Vineibacter sp.]